jgi:hypothetical protein
MCARLIRALGVFPFGKVEMNLKKQSLCKLAPLLLICLMSACQRLNTEAANRIMRDIRTAEAAFKKDFGRYGTLKELAEAQLISNSLADGIDKGYNFEMKPNVDSYEVIAVPLERDDKYQYVGWSFYLNQSGVIRGRTYGKANSYSVANKDDPPVRYQ